MNLTRSCAALVRHRHVRAFALAACVTFLAACGGSSGGGGNGTDVRFSSLSPAQANVDVAEGAQAPDLTLSTQLSGDLAALNGKTLFVVIEEPLGLFAPTAQISYDSTTARASVVLSGQPQTVPGSRNGRLAVRVCLDAACQTRLTPDGFGIDVTVRVRTGLRISPAQVSVSVPFGTVPTPALVSVVAPEGRAATDFTFGIVAPNLTQVLDVSGPNPAGGPGVLVSPRLLPVGRYERRLEISATSADSGLAARTYVTGVPLVIEVLPSAVEYAVAPSSLTFTIDHGTARLQPFTVGAVAQTGSFRLDPVIYDNSGDPPEAATSPMRNQWLNTSGDAWAVGVCAGPSCLPRGTYRATLRFVRYDANNFPTGLTVDVPVTLTVR
jgi:hypothetical protein